MEAKYSKRAFKGEQTISPTSIANFPSQEATPLRPGRESPEVTCGSRSVKYGRESHFEKTFGEIDFDVAFTSSHGEVMSVPLKASKQQYANKKRSFSMSCLVSEVAAGSMSECLAGDMDMFMTSSNYSNAIYHGKRSRSNSLVQQDNVADQANAEWNRNFKYDRKNDSHRAKKQNITSDDGRFLSKLEVTSSNPSSRTSNSSNKYATVGLDIDCPPSFTEAKASEQMSSSSSSIPPCTLLTDLLSEHEYNTL